MVDEKILKHNEEELKEIARELAEKAIVALIEKDYLESAYQDIVLDDSFEPIFRVKVSRLYKRELNLKEE